MNKIVFYITACGGIWYLQSMNLPRVRECENKSWLARQIAQDTPLVEGALQLYTAQESSAYTLVNEQNEPIIIEKNQAIPTSIELSERGKEIVGDDALQVEIPVSLVEGKKEGEIVSFYVKKADAEKIEVKAHVK